MNTNASKVLNAEFAAETRFDLKPTSVVPFRGIWETALEQLKNRLLVEHLRAAGDPGLYAPIRRAANEATSLAWATPFSLLVLPELLNERIAEERKRYHRQVLVRRKTRELLRKAA